MDKIYNFFDFTLANNIKCENRDINEINNFYGMIKNKTLRKYTKFAFPSTINISRGNNTKNLQHYLFSNIIELDPNSNLSDNYETELEFITDENKTTKGELKINLIKNQTLSENQKKISAQSDKVSIYDNVLLIFLSSVSRAHFQRGMPKLSKFISKLMSYEPFPTMTSYQFSKYKNFPYTIGNIKDLFYKDNIDSLKYFKESGYITGQVSDLCEKNMNNKNIFDFDHENFVMSCDPNYFLKKEFSTYERCLYGKPISEHMINYTSQFWEKYSENKKYFRMTFNYGNEPTGNVIRYLDEPLYNMLWNFYNQRKLRNSAVFIISEQGNRNNGLYNILGSVEFEIEKKYGVFIMLLDWNEKFQKEQFHKNLIKNQDLFITPYDIYDTVVHIALGENYVNSSSVLNVVNMEDTYCYKN